MLDRLSVFQRKLINWLGFLVVIGIGFMLIQPPKSTSNRGGSTHPPQVLQLAMSRTAAVMRVKLNSG